MLGSLQHIASSSVAEILDATDLNQSQYALTPHPASVRCRADHDVGAKCPGLSVLVGLAPNRRFWLAKRKAQRSPFNSSVSFKNGSESNIKGTLSAYSGA
ncbi:hypothetical protein WJX75_006064 [Coccomyxa subellipsoidea]|uniref:Uncharacterized protein n=1 Tax=Coccomyxa subellipsoidea TaxID=248742 RepID=A0ABR2YEI0_9CHLO